MPQGNRKPADFPLFQHASGRWCKKVRGKHVYFGKVADDPTGQAALSRWLDERDDLLGGRKPQRNRGLATMEQVAFAFLNRKQAAFDNGELTARSMTNYKMICKKITLLLGRNRIVADLQPEDFHKLRGQLAEGVGLVSLRNYVRMTKTVLRFAYNAGLIPNSLRYGDDFKTPRKKTIKREARTGGKKFIDAADVRELLEVAKQPLRAMILCGVNFGAGNTDLSEMQFSDIDLDAGWYDCPRRKTEEDRRAKLWPETIQAIREAIAMRPRPASQADEQCVFLTRFGARFVRTSEAGSVCDGVAGQFVALQQAPQCPGCRAINLPHRGTTPDECRRCGWKPTKGQPWIGPRHQRFYALRHDFQTVADESLDFPAVRFAMGHSGGTMSDEYREGVSDERLERVAEHVRIWLWPHLAKPAGKRATKKRPAK